MSWPFLFIAYRHAWSAGAADDYGEAADTYTPAANTTGTETKAFWAAPISEEPKLAGHDRVAVDLELFVPKGTTATAHDLWDVDDKQYEAVGEPEEYNHGPFGMDDNPLVINLRRIEG